MIDILWWHLWWYLWRNPVVDSGFAVLGSLSYLVSIEASAVLIADPWSVGDFNREPWSLDWRRYFGLQSGLAKVSWFSMDDGRPWRDIIILVIAR
jgi:hypothetical protein